MPLRKARCHVAAINGSGKMIGRRELAFGAVAAMLVGGLGLSRRAGAGTTALTQRLAAIRSEAGGRFGVRRARHRHRGHGRHRLDRERFAMCSTFKAA